MNELNKALSALESLTPAHAKLAKSMLEAFGGKMYPVDIFAMAVLNRSIDLLQGFSLLMKADNYLAAAPLVRLQLDNLLRFQATWLVKDPHDFAISVMRGTPVRQLKDRNGNKMQDAMLVEELAKTKSWARSVYEETSGFIHLSEKHIVSLLDKPIDDQGKFQLSIGRSGEKVPLPFKIEAVNAFEEITNEIFTLVNGWIYTKSNPELVASLREDRY